MVQSLITRPPTNYGYKVLKTVVFDGSAGKGAIGTISLFIVVGTIRAKITAWCNASLEEDGDPGGATLEVGIEGTTDALIPQTQALDIDAGEIWYDATPDKALEPNFAAKEFMITNGLDIILTVATDEVTAGTLVFCLEYYALSNPGGLEPA